MTDAQPDSALLPGQVRIEEARYLTSSAALVTTREGLPVLDYPWVARAGDANAAATVLRAALAGPAGEGARAKAGFFEPGAPVASIRGVSMKLLPHLGAADIRTSYAMTGTTGRPDNVLAVVDISGSMGENTDGHGAAMDDVHASATPMIGVLPPGSKVGLWAFGNQLAPPVDYEELVPIAPLESNAAQFAAQVSRMRAEPTGTALYRTVLAAYQNVQTHYDAGANNVVAVFTDGRNQDVTGLDLAGLVQELTRIKNPAKPVQFLFFGFGDADPAAMQQIVDAVGNGGVWVITSRAQIIGGMLEAAGQNTENFG